MKRLGLLVVGIVIFLLIMLFVKTRDPATLECFVSTGDPGHHCVEKK